MISIGNAAAIYNFSKIKGANIAKLTEGIIKTNDAEHIYYFAKDINGVNIQKYDYDEYMSVFSVVFQDFNLFKSGKEITQKDSRYTVSWSSSDEDVIWINAKSGKARADKFGNLSDEYVEATVTAKITNKTTRAVAYRRFKVSVGTPEPELPGIKDVFAENGMKAGTCLSDQMIKKEMYTDVIKKNFNSITFENHLKPDYILDQAASKAAGEIIVKIRWKCWSGVKQTIWQSAAIP